MVTILFSKRKKIYLKKKKQRAPILLRSTDPPCWKMFAAPGIFHILRRTLRTERISYDARVTENTRRYRSMYALRVYRGIFSAHLPRCIAAYFRSTDPPPAAVFLFSFFFLLLLPLPPLASPPRCFIPYCYAARKLRASRLLGYFVENSREV